MAMPDDICQSCETKPKNLPENIECLMISKTFSKLTKKFESKKNPVITKAIFYEGRLVMYLIKKKGTCIGLLRYSMHLPCFLAPTEVQGNKTNDITLRVREVIISDV